MKRRDFILSTMATAPTAAIAKAPADPVIALFERWADAGRACDAYYHQTDGCNNEAKEMALLHEQERCLDALVGTNATTPHGALCQALALWEEEGPLLSITLGHEAYHTREHRLLQRLIFSLADIAGHPATPAIRSGCWSVSDF